VRATHTFWYIVCHAHLLVNCLPHTLLIYCVPCTPFGILCATHTFWYTACHAHFFIYRVSGTPFVILRATHTFWYIVCHAHLLVYGVPHTPFDILCATHTFFIYCVPRTPFGISQYSSQSNRSGHACCCAVTNHLEHQLLCATKSLLPAPEEWESDLLSPRHLSFGSYPLGLSGLGGPSGSNATSTLHKAPWCRSEHAQGNVANASSFFQRK
jgi:hypothetical protein